MKNSPLVSVVVVTLDNVELLKNCLESLSGQTYENMETIVVDNGSSEDIQGMLKENFPHAAYLRCSENLGFAAGNNRGIEMARGDYVALINNDAVASSMWVESMVKTAEADTNVGQVASIIEDGNRPGFLDSLGLGIAFDGMSRQNMRQRPVPVLEEPKEVLMASGCACMFRAAALEESGGFDEDFFNYCEDSDLGLRLRLLGWKVVAAPGALVSHHYSMTTGKFSLKKVYFVERNHYWVAVKNFPLLLLLAVPFVTAWRFIVSASMISNKSRALSGFSNENPHKEIMAALVRAYKDMFYGLPSMFRKRFAARGTRRLGIFNVLSLLWRFRLSMGEILGGR